MQIPLELSGKGHDLTQREKLRLRAEVKRLQRYCDRLIGCRVVVSVSHRRPDGDPIAYSLRLALVVPGAELAVNRQAKPSFAEAVDDAFSAARRQLQDHIRLLRRDVKRHSYPMPASERGAP